MNDLSLKLAKTLISKSGSSKDNEPIVVYAIEVLFLNMVNIGLSLIIGYLFGLLIETAVCLITVSLLRRFTGGSHSHSAIACLIITSIIFPLLSYIAALTSNILSSSAANVSFILIGVAALILSYFFAPAEVAAAPIISNQRRKRLKLASILSVIGIILLVEFDPLTLDLPILWCIALSLAWVMFSMSPVGFKFFEVIDQVVFKEVKS